MSNKAPFVYWDACCFIGRIQREADKTADLDHLTKLAEDGKLIIVTSTLTISEVLYDPADTGDKNSNLRLITRYFEHPWIVLRAVDRKTSELAAEIRLAHSLEVADAIHLATALRWKVRLFHTYDKRHLLRKNGLIGDPPLEIIKPRSPEYRPLLEGIKDEPTFLKLVADDSDDKAAGPDKADPARADEEAADVTDSDSPRDLGNESVQGP